MPWILPNMFLWLRKVVFAIWFPSSYWRLVALPKITCLHPLNYHTQKFKKEDIFFNTQTVCFFMEPQGPLEKTSWRPFTATNTFFLEESVQQIDIRYCFTPFKKGLFWRKKNTGATQGIVAASVVEVVVEAVLEVNGVDLLELSSLMSKFNSSGRYLGLQLGKARLKQPSINTFNKWNCKILSDLSVYFLMELPSKNGKQFEIWIFLLSYSTKNQPMIGGDLCLSPS